MSEEQLRVFGVGNTYMYCGDERSMLGKWKCTKIEIIEMTDKLVTQHMAYSFLQISKRANTKGGVIAPAHTFVTNVPQLYFERLE